MDGILINGVFHEAIQSDMESFKCDKCSLKDFCEEIGISASSLMNMFAKTVIRNQEVPFALTTRPLDNSKYSRLFPRSESELDHMLSEAENTPSELCVPAGKAFASFEERMGW